jgi:hypothetical protein
MRVLIRTSPAAIWARRFAALALPLTILAVLLHYGGQLDGRAFTIAAAVAIAVSVLALVLSLAALVTLWFSGDRGWGRAFGAFFIALVCLLPAAAAAYAVWHYPDVGDVTTDPGSPPLLMSTLPLDPAGVASDPAVLVKAFPGLRSRRYSLDAPSLFQLLAKLVADRGWKVIGQTAPATGLDVGQINALATALGGWRDEVAIRVSGDSAGSVVDMRSAALSPGPDLGANGRRIVDFLSDLDAQVTRRLRNSPANSPGDQGDQGDQAGPDSDSDIITAPVPAPAPSPTRKGSKPGGGG